MGTAEEQGSGADGDALSSAIDRTLDAARKRLLESFRAGAFRGQLSSSALSTAVAAQALSLAAREDDREGDAARAARGRAWILAHQNPDGGYGDTTDSPSNVSTSTLVWATLGLAEAAAQQPTEVLQRCEQYLLQQYGRLEAEPIAATISARYGVDRTFSVPILSACALAGRFGDGPEAWRPIPALPFELAALPHTTFAWIGLPTVSYALPALVAMGQIHHERLPSRFPPLRWLRGALRERTLEHIREMQPGSGGYLEAAPLTGFVCMCLIACGRREHAVVQHGLRFLRQTQREDGSWPIDTNLDTWTTTLAVNALYSAKAPPDELASPDQPARTPGTTAPAPAAPKPEWPAGFDDEARRETARWLLQQQTRQRHPFTRARPGAWAWTDLSGGVPDADDTPGALLALAHLTPPETPSARSGASAAGGPPSASLDAAAATAAASAGVRWLLDLQNKDGGVPTFCRGWGKLPFDRSSPDLTAHTLRAWQAWRDRLPALSARIDRAVQRAADYLDTTQRSDGAWVPLWFGNQSTPEQENPLYGTTRVLRALAPMPAHREAAARAARWTLGIQNDDGGFGGDRGAPSTVEETAWAVEALAEWCGQLASRAGDAGRDPGQPDTDLLAVRAAVRRGVRSLLQQTAEGQRFPCAPLGLYFAKLWYTERLYPVLFTASALRRVQEAGVTLEGPAGY